MDVHTNGDPKDAGALLQEIKNGETEMLRRFDEMEAARKKDGEAHGESLQKFMQSEQQMKASHAALDQRFKDFEAKSSKDEEVIEELKTRLKDQGEQLDSMQATAGMVGYGGPQVESKTIGQRFIEDQTAIAAFQEKTIPGDSVRVNAGNFFPEFQYWTPETKTLLDSSTPSRLVQPFRMPEIVGPQLRILRMRSLIPTQPISGNAFYYVKESYMDEGSTGSQIHGAADFRAEGGAVAEARLVFEEVTGTIRSLAHYLPVTEELLLDFPQLRSYIDARLRFGVAYKEDSQLLYGPGTGSTITGIMVDSGTQSYTHITDGEATDTFIDTVRRAATKAHDQEYVPDGVVLNPNDWETIELMKGNDQHYIWSKVSSGVGSQLFAYPVVSTNAMVAGSGLVAAFQMAFMIWDRQSATLEVGAVDDDFIKLRKAIRAVERIGLASMRPSAAVKIDFTP